MSKAVFADLQGWIALLNRSDRYHTAACEAMNAFARDCRAIVTTDWVLAETGNGLARTQAWSEFVEAVRRLKRSSSTTIVKIDDDSFQ